MAQADKRVEPARNPEVPGTLLDDPMARKLVAEMLAGRIANVKPQYDFTTELGYTYPVVEQAANLKGKDALAMMESLAARDIVAKSFFDRLIRCPRCQGVN